ncbi:polysaccharide lyase [Flexithrix dorotheae]|uniref:polysaccharide lyase n=1 Tax=Flexithrix dorotheae TaxID=70993 RepID=UPI0003A50433|nr:hypothetical protein [Flexithrix dorotheae]
MISTLILLALFLASACNHTTQKKDVPPTSYCLSCTEEIEGIIFCDDFESDDPLSNRYFEYHDDNGDFVRLDGVGRDGSAGMRAIWQKGEVDAGALRKSFGKTPGEYISKHASFPQQQFNEIYWKLEVKNQIGWEGGGAAKLTRVTTMVNDDWAQGMIGHIWSGGPENNYLVLDPASGISEGGELVSQKYNDFDHLRWLGNITGTTDLFNDSNVGKWYCVVGHVKLNTPGQANGVFEFWIDDTLQAARYDLNWHSDWNTNPENMMINAVFFENYWNSGSPKQQERYFDNILVSTNPITCNCKEE